MRCKPGQMCRQIKAFLPENVGLVVETLHLDSAEDFGPEWICKPAWPCRGARVANGAVVSLDQASSRPVWIPDAWLEPILPPEQPETVTNEETAEA